MDRTEALGLITADAELFGRLAKGGEWALALLVARSAQPSKPGSKRKDKIVPRETIKVSFRDFAKLAQTTPQRVSRYYAAWERAAEAGHVPHASDLKPGRKLDLNSETLPAFADFYDTGRRPSTVEATEDDSILAAAIQANPKALADTIRSNAKVRDALRAELGEEDATDWLAAKLGEEREYVPVVVEEIPLADAGIEPAPGEVHYVDEISIGPPIEAVAAEVAEAVRLSDEDIADIRATAGRPEVGVRPETQVLSEVILDHATVVTDTAHTLSLYRLTAQERETLMPATSQLVEAATLLRDLVTGAANADAWAASLDGGK